MHAEEQLFYTSHGIRKRRIYFNVEFTEEERKWILAVRKQLKQDKHIHIEEDQTLLRYYYSSDLQMEQCVAKLAIYHEWFHNPDIQTITAQTHSVLREGFVYSYGKGREGRPFVIMNISRMDLDKFPLNVYYQALNHVNNRVIREEFTPGYIESYDYILDLEEQLLSLPLGSLSSIIKVISDVYSMRLAYMKIVNCTFATKWFYNRLANFISEETTRKIELLTSDDLKDGKLTELISDQVLERKYGGSREDIVYDVEERTKGKLEHSFVNELLNETEYFSIEENESFFAKQEAMACCGNDACTIY